MLLLSCLPGFVWTCDCPDGPLLEGYSNRGVSEAHLSCLTGRGSAVWSEGKTTRSVRSTRCGNDVWNKAYTVFEKHQCGDISTVACLNWKIKSIFKRLLVVVNIYDSHMSFVGPCTVLKVWIRDHICILTLLADWHPSVKLCQKLTGQDNTLQT